MFLQHNIIYMTCQPSASMALPSGDTNLEIANRVARISPLTASCHPLRSFGVAQCWMAAILNTYYPADDRRLRPLLLDPLGGCQATVLVALF